MHPCIPAYQIFSHVGAIQTWEYSSSQNMNFVQSHGKLCLKPSLMITQSNDSTRVVRLGDGATNYLHKHTEGPFEQTHSDWIAKSSKYLSTAVRKARM